MQGSSRFCEKMRVVRVRALIEYEVVGDSEYRYIDAMEECHTYKRLAVRHLRDHFIRRKLNRGIICVNIKQISIEDVRD